MNPPIFKKKRRNRRRATLKKNADNPFTEKTGVEVIQLTGTSKCLVTSQKAFMGIPVRKVSYAISNDWQAYETSASAKRMKNLLVKSVCGVDQCINPEHLVGREREVINGGWG